MKSLRDMSLLMILGSTAAVALAFFTTGCGGGSSGGSSSGGGKTSGSGIAGAYEFVATSSSTGDVTLIEADISVNGSQSSASGPSQVQTATYANGTWYVNGVCSSPSPGQNSISATVNGSNIALTFNEGGNTFTGQGTLAGTSISGSYSGNNANCSDSGTFTGTVVPNLAGTFAGNLSFPGGSDYVVATLTEGSNYSLAVQTTLTGTDNGNFTFSGSAVGNVMFVSGSINSGAFSLFGYFDSTGRFTGTANSIAVFDYNTLAYDGLLTAGQGSGGTPTSLAITTSGGSACTASSPCGLSEGGTALQLEAIATFPEGATQNYTSLSTWTASPSGIVTLSSASGVEDVTGVAAGTVTITATSSNNLTATAVVTVNPATLNTVIVTPLGDGLAVGATANYTATATLSDGSMQNVTTSASWTSSTSGVATVGATTGVVKAVAAGQTTISATYQGVTGSTALNVVATAAYSDASLSGDYGFTLTATGTNAAKQSVPEYFIGSMSFNGKGGITGAMDSNTTSGVSTNVTVTGTYSVFADGRGTLTLTGSGLPSSSYRLILTSNLLGTISGQFVQFDGKGAAIGTLIQQIASTTLSASEVFRFTGVDSAGNPFGEVGEFATGAGSTVTSGEFDEDDFGTVTQSQTISGGSYTAPATNGRGTLKLTVGSATSNFVFYVVQAGNLILLSTDTSAPVLLGYAEEQSGRSTTGHLPTTPGTATCWSVRLPQDAEPSIPLDELDSTVRAG